MHHPYSIFSHAPVYIHLIHAKKATDTHSRGGAEPITAGKYLLWSPAPLCTLLLCQLRHSLAEGEKGLRGEARPTPSVQRPQLRSAPRPCSPRRIIVFRKPSLFLNPAPGENMMQHTIKAHAVKLERYCKDGPRFFFSQPRFVFSPFWQAIPK